MSMINIEMDLSELSHVTCCGFWAGPLVASLMAVLMCSEMR